MFHKPLDLTRVRSAKDAVGFYIVQFLLALLAAAVASAFYGVIQGSNSFMTGIKIGSTVAGLWALVLSFLVLRAHRNTSRPWYVVLAILAGLIGLFGGALFGLVIPAFLTTRKR